MRIGGIYEANYPLQFLLHTKLVLGENETDMTAIAVVSMPEGFVIGADGLRQTVDRLVVNDKAQKIFSFQTEKIVLAYAWCGHTVCWNGDNPAQIFFNFMADTEQTLTLASLAEDLSAFIKSIRDIFQTLLLKSNQVYPGWATSVQDESIARMIVAGYFNRESFLLEVKVQEVNSFPFVSVQRLVPSNQLKAFSGHLVATSDDAALTRVPSDVGDARNLVFAYIQKCGDSSESKNVGGRTHVALVSPDSFDWIDAPENSN